jgi:hypothetical protein
MLTSEKGLPIELYSEIWQKKQKITLDKLKILEYCTTQTKETLYNIVKS